MSCKKNFFQVMLCFMLNVVCKIINLSNLMYMIIKIYNFFGFGLLYIYIN